MLTPWPDRGTGPLHRPTRAADSAGPTNGQAGQDRRTRTRRQFTGHLRLSVLRPRESVSPVVVTRTRLRWNQPVLGADGQTPGEAQGKRLTIDLRKAPTTLAVRSRATSYSIWFS
jgi:hypothetical protein